MDRSERIVVFITYQYPFLPGEYFIEEEIKYLAKAFDRVVVVPARCLFWKPKEVREMPEGVELWNPGLVHFLRYLTWGMGAFLRAPFHLRQQNQKWPGRADIPTVSRLTGLKSAFKTVFFANALRWFARERQLPNGCFGYAYWRDFGAAGLTLCREQLRLRKVYVRCHRIDIYSDFRWPSETIIHATSDGIFPISSDGKYFLEETKGLPSGPIEVHRLGVRIPPVCSVPSNDGVYRILSCSNLIPVKRVNLIARVVGRLPFPVEWTHIGDGPEGDAIKELVEGFDAKHVVVFKGRLSNQQVYESYKSSPVDLFINLSESEGVPVSIMEALAHGVPVVATDVGGTAEIIDEKVGKLVPVDLGAEQVCDAISELREREQNGMDIRLSARKRAEERCSSQKNYVGFCERLLAE